MSVLGIRQDLIRPVVGRDDGKTVLFATVEDIQRRFTIRLFRRPAVFQDLRLCRRGTFDLGRRGKILIRQPECFLLGSYRCEKRINQGRKAY